MEKDTGTLSVMAELKKFDHEIIILNHACEVLRWDQETCMPPRAIGERAEQIAQLQGLAHDRIVDPKQPALFESVGMSEKTKMGPPSLSDETRGFLRETFRRYTKHLKVPKTLIEEIARTQSVAQAEWVRAKKASDYGIFKPHLKKLVELMRSWAECQGFAEEIYDALLDEYEPWMTTRELAAVFEGLKPRLGAILEKIKKSPKKTDDKILTRAFPVDKQRAFSELLLDAMGFDRERGRIDVSAHPFTTTLGAHDIRLTTRYNENFLPSSLFGTIHECGHGLYEQGMGEALRGSILANGASLGIHESQSRLWENLVGRSLSFWRRFFPRLAALCPETLAGVGVEDFYRAINTVSPSHIRVEADEVTYNLHIILRFTLERKIIAGDLGLDDIPDAWRETSRELLGLIPPSDSEGLLQDVHWSMGAFGYFPTYTLGNLAASQIFTALRKAHPDIEERIVAGELAVIREWLVAHIHAHGAVYTAQDLLERSTGERLDPRYFASYLETKYGALYDF